MAGRTALLAAAGCLFVASLLHTSPAVAATFVINNLDGPGEGLNDTNPADPVGGNSGATLGEQRLNVVLEAVQEWGVLLDSSVPIIVDIRFDPIPCDILARALPGPVARDFSGAPRASTWYVSPLANKFAGTDLEPAASDFRITVNSAASCALNFYLGLDRCPNDLERDLVSLLVHELAHGLGFATLVNPFTGTKFFGSDDAFMIHLEVHSLDATFAEIGNAARMAASVSDGDLHWIGPALVDASPCYSEGRHPIGHILMFAPTTVAPGSSLSHFDDRLKPVDHMLPSYTRAYRKIQLSAQVLDDIGWGTLVATPCDCSLSLMQCLDEVCGAADKECRRDARQEKRECTTNCRTIKRQCKTTCKDTRRACLDQCNGDHPRGKARRQCRRGCRLEKRQCTKTCRTERRECKTTCRTTKRNCKDGCDLELDDCSLSCKAKVLGCLGR